MKQIEQSGTVGAWRRWRWVVLYVALLLCSAYLVPVLVETTYRLHLGWIIRFGPGALIVLGMVWTARRIVRMRSRRSPRALGGLGVLAVGYGAFLLWLSEHPVERLHLLEYGLLGVLLYRPLRRARPPARSWWFSLVGLLLVGFADEVLQGFLSGRYYDPRDILLNEVSGIFGIALYVLGREMWESRAPAREPTAGFRGPGRVDGIAVGAVGIVLAVMAYLQEAPLGREALYGVWERPSQCGGIERFRFSAPDRFVWEDERGSRVRGRFEMGGNRLDAARITFTIGEIRNPTRCGLRGDLDRPVSSYVIVGGDTFFFDRKRDRPWFRRPLQSLQD